MDRPTAQRRLLKSPPELWAEVSRAESLSRHLAQFGEIRITRVEPETTVAWEGERASGTVELAPAGWGTKVILTATIAERPPAAASPPRATVAPDPAAVAPTPPPPADPEPTAAADPAAVTPAPPPPPEPEPEPTAVRRPPPNREAVAPPQRRRGFFARLFRRHQTRERPAAPLRAQAPAPAAAPTRPPGPTHAPAPTHTISQTPPPAPPEPSPPALGPEPPPPAPDPAPTLPEPTAAPPAVERLDTRRTVAILTKVLDDLGADHRSLSRNLG